MSLKINILLFVSLLTINAFSQKKTVKKKATTQTVATAKTDAKTNASRIIQFSNSVIEMGNSYGETLNNYQALLKNADSNMERLVKNPNLSVQFINCNIISVQDRQQMAYAAASKAVSDFSEKADIIRFVAEGENYAKSIGTWCAALSKYNSNKEFKDDKQYVIYKSIRDSLDSYIGKTSDSWRLASSKASEAGSRAELILLEGSPIASFVIPMKKDLIAIDNILKMFNTEKPDLEAIKQALSEEKKSIEINKDITTKDVSKLRDIYYKDVYQSFYRQCSSVVESLNTVTDRLNEKEPNMDNIKSWFSSASGNYGKIIEEYNKFVSQ